MRKNDDERWPEDVDLDRVRAAPRSIAGGWAVVAVFAGLMFIGPPTVDTLDVALHDAKQEAVKAKHEAVKVEHHLAQVLPRSLSNCPRPG